MGKPSRTELILICAACASLALTVGLRLGIGSGSSAVVTERSAPPAAVSALQTPEILGDGNTININSASAERLALLPGIGAALADRIVAYREANGDFSDISGIMNVSGIGDGKFAKIRDLITVGDTS
ncbi:MAG: ComEA family DNA-binding protein [Oscillospiraceae bacterium]